MRYPLVLALIIMAASITSCQDVQGTPTPIAPPTTTPTASSTPAATWTPTIMPTRTALPSATPTATPTTYPTPSAGELLYLCYADENDNHEWDMGDEWGVACGVLLQGYGEPRVYTQLDAPRGVAAALLAPGGYGVQLYWVDPCYDPLWDYTGYVIVERGRTVIGMARMWRRYTCATVTPTATIMPTRTAVP